MVGMLTFLSAFDFKDLGLALRGQHLWTQNSGILSELNVENAHDSTKAPLFDDVHINEHTQLHTLPTEIQDWLMILIRSAFADVQWGIMKLVFGAQNSTALSHEGSASSSVSTPLLR